ncbi:TetR family transcriptional regulator [Streptomyces telluris]|uniref:TetR family transcriptional regulator n=1 Tax=Streptomyces telluris TaxID=2720021 RepID=A0A9X2RLH0_9ACTN|nr:TetR family transcriptional regulator [Streptomyces telluris]MCQ8770878.1 TetR family transcriptional regulator [Streptomyces telluris]NJP79560.1 TetR/AcrR family transcriptional regulator [Streptomyces telluris]
MAVVRDPEATKARIFAAATAEFAAHGIAGARIDRIAREAKANKQLIYAYFGDKAELFSQVLQRALLELASAVPVDADDPDCYVDRLMEYHKAHPELLRLLLWEGLEYGEGEIPHEAERRARYDSKAAAFAVAQEEGTVDAGLPPRHLVFLISALAGWGTAVPQFRRLLVGGEDGDLAALRESVRTAARRITQPGA